MNKADVAPKARRFYETVRVGEAEQGGFSVLLDGRAARTPGANALALPTPELAQLVAAEWLAQGDTLNWGTMPATRLAGVAIDGGHAGRDRATQIIGDYASSDLICYFAPFPKALVARQAEVWGPILEWARQSRGLDFRSVTGVIHQAQPATTLANLTEILMATDDFTLAGLALGASLFGSAILALALAAARVDGAAAVAAARLDELFQEGQWGRDAESDRRAQALAHDAQMLEGWFAALSQPLCGA